MRIGLKLFLFFLLTTVLHWGLMAMLGGWDISLNLMLVFALAVCAFVKPEYGYPTAFICGLFLDFFGVKLFGHYAFMFTLCAAIVYSLETRVDFDSVVPQMACIGVLALLSAIGNLILLKVFAGFSAWNGFWPFIGGIILSALIAPAVFWVVRSAFTVKLKTY